MTPNEFGKKCKNKIGDWVPAIPEPYYHYLNILECVCGKHFWTRERYEEHYALRHILNL
jgi:hypothetical protein